MTNLHTPGYYMDGHKAVEFCKVCGAEGLELVDDCPRIINSNKKALDEKEQTAKEAVTGIGE